MGVITTPILQFVIVVALGTILYIFARALPRVSDIDTSIEKRSSFHWVLERLEVIDEKLISALEKFIRRIRVVVLRADNSLTKKLSRFKRDNEKEKGFPTEHESIIEDNEETHKT